MNLKIKNWRNNFPIDDAAKKRIGDEENSAGRMSCSQSVPQITYNEEGLIEVFVDTSDSKTLLTGWYTNENSLSRKSTIWYYKKLPV